MSSAKLITVVVSALFLLIVSAVLRSSELYFMSGALISVPVISYALGRVAIRGLQCSEEAPEYSREGEPIEIRLHLHGRTSLLGSIELHYLLPEWLEKDERQEAPVRESPDRVSISHIVVSKKRGEYTLGPLRLRVSDPLGFFRFNCDYPITSQLVVLPRPLHVPDLYTRPTGGLGEHQFEGAGAKGTGTDFAGVREYHPGDELKRVHWRSLAKHGRLNVIEFEHGRGDDAVIAVDLKEGTETGSGCYTSLEYAARIAAGLSEQILTLGGTIKLASAGLEGPAAVPGRGLDHLHIVLDVLARVQANQRESLSNVLLGELDSIGHDSLVVCLTSSVDDDFCQCAELLIAREAKVQLVLINPTAEPRHMTRQLASRLAAAGVSIALLDCSPEAVAVHIRCDYAA